MERRIADGLARIRSRSQRPVATRPSTVEFAETSAVDPSEFCEVVAGHVLLCFDAAVRPTRRSIAVAYDGLRSRRLRTRLSPLGGQLLSNGDFSAGLDGWALEARQRGSKIGIDLSPEWTLEGGHTVYVRSKGGAVAGGTLTYEGEGRDPVIAVIGGREYELSALVAAHRCEVTVSLGFLDADGHVIDEISDLVVEGTRGGRERADYHFTRASARAPDGAVAARLSFDKGPTIEGEQDSFMFISEVQVGWPGRLLPDYAMTPDRREQIARWSVPTCLSAPLPLVVLDGEAHVVDVRDPDEGRSVAGSPVHIQQLRTYDGDVEAIRDSTLTGWFADHDDPAFITPLALELDGVEVSRTRGPSERVAGGHAFRLAIPAGAFDGGPHHLLVRAVPDGSVVRELATVLEAPAAGRQSTHIGYGPEADGPEGDGRSAAQLSQALADSEQARFRLARQVRELSQGGSRNEPEQRASRPAATRAAVHEAGRRGRAAVVVWDVGHNAVGRAQILADLLSEDWDVELIGPSWARFGSGLWQPYRSVDLDVRWWACRDLSDFVPQAFLEASATDYDLVCVSKPRLPSMLLGLLIKEHSGCPMVLDIDDDELAFAGGGMPVDLADLESSATQALVEPYGALATRYAVSLVDHADAITVSNTALRDRYGGHLVRHARDERVFVTDEQTRAASRLDLGIGEDEFALLLVGTLRAHKGAESIARVLERMGDPGIRLHVVGEIRDRETRDELARFEGSSVVLHELRAFGDVPRTLAAADAVPLLQDPSAGVADYQIPAKLSDALALGIPVLTTSVPPLTDVIASGAVWEVDEGDLEDTIRSLRDDPEPGRQRRIREYFLSEFSYAVNRARLRLAVDAAARAPGPLPEDLEALKELVTRVAGTIARKNQSVFTASAVSAMHHDGKPRTEQRDLAVFWKQNDSGIYGRRVEMLVKYLIKTGQVDEVLYFDAPIGIDEIERFREMAGTGNELEQRLLLRNTLLRWLGLLDRPTLKQRVFIHAAGGQDRLMARQLPPADTYADWVASQLQSNGFSPESTIAWACPVVWRFPEIRARIPFAGVVVDLIDDQRSWPSEPDYRDLLDASYGETIGLADLVLSNCQPTAAAFASSGKAIHVIPNGTESLEVQGAPRPRALAGLPKPVIGYVGNMRDRIDWSLLAAVASKKEAWSFVLAGPTDARPEAEALADLPNVHFPGVVEYAELGAYLGRFDAAIVPHARSPVARSMNPLKIYNYLAAGLPVVSTSIPNVEDLEGLVEFADSSDAFIEALERVLKGSAHDASSVRDLALDQFGWEQRALAIGRLLDEHLTSSGAVAQGGAAPADARAQPAQDR